MIVVDSSGWIEYHTDGPLAGRFAPYLADLDQILTPAIIVYEVCKKIRRDRGEDEADEAVAVLSLTHVRDLDSSLALSAAEISLDHHLAMADAIIYATARDARVELVTMDPHFEGLAGVVLVRPKRAR